MRPGGRAALVWNNRDPSDGFTAEYLELLLAGGADARKTLAASLGTQTDNVLFRHETAETLVFPHTQILDFTGLLGLTLSASFIPKPGDDRYPELTERLQKIFDRHQIKGAVTVVYRTVAIFGPID